MNDDETLSLRTLVTTVAAAVDAYTPPVLTIADHEVQVPQVFALAAIHRMTDFLQSELVLSLNDRNSTTRPLGRTIVELWLNTNELLLDPEAAMDRLEAEDITARGQLQHGFETIWNRYEKVRDEGIDLRDPNFERAEGQRSNIETLSMRVAQLRKDQGLGSGGLAELNYQMTYRRDSVEDLHVTMDHLFRYLNFDEGVVTFLRTPDIHDTNALRGPLAIREDAQLVVDALGLYLKVSGQDGIIEDLKVFLGSPQD